MAAATAIALTSAAVGLFAAKQQADALSAQGEYGERQAAINNRLANMQADDTLARGDQQANQIGRNTRKIAGAQRAGFAAQGIALDSGSAQDIQVETAEMGALDQLTVRNNAAREAWGYRVQGQQGVFSAQNQAEGNRRAGQATLLTGGMNAANAIAQGFANGGFRGGGGGGQSSDNSYAINRRNGG